MTNNNIQLNSLLLKHFQKIKIKAYFKYVFFYSFLKNTLFELYYYCIQWAICSSLLLLLVVVVVYSL
jgi:hypothetical protein